MLKLKIEAEQKKWEEFHTILKIQDDHGCIVCWTGWGDSK